MQKNILQQETLTHKLISKWFWAYVFVIFTAPLWYLIRLVASNTLSVSDIWIFYWVLSLITLLYSYNDLWLTESMQYFLPKYWLENKKWQIKNTIWLSFFMQLITWITIFCLLFFNAEWLAIHHFHEAAAENVIKIMSLYFLWYNLIQVSNSIFVHDGPYVYPNFNSLLKIVPQIINKSHYVGEAKGTYEGALLTRIAMLTNGIASFEKPQITSIPKTAFLATLCLEMPFSLFPW